MSFGAERNRVFPYRFAVGVRGYRRCGLVGSRFAGEPRPMTFPPRRSPIRMGKLTYGMNVSVDGYIADANGDIGWSVPDEELHRFWNDQVRDTAVSLYGRRLYELMAAY